MRTIRDLYQLAALVEKSRGELFVRWSKGPAEDLKHGKQASRDELTGVKLPGLSASPLAVESWWGERPLVLWVGRRLYDYAHLREKRGPEVRPWILAGKVCGRGPDNEPLVECSHPVAWITEAVLQDAVRLVDAQGAADWGPMDRRGGGPSTAKAGGSPKPTVAGAA